MIEHKRHVMLGFETELRLLNKAALAVERFVASCLNVLGVTGFGSAHLFDEKERKGGD